MNTLSNLWKTIIPVMDGLGVSVECFGVSHAFYLKTACQAEKGILYHNSRIFEGKTGEKQYRNLWETGLFGMPEIAFRSSQSRRCRHNAMAMVQVFLQRFARSAG